MLGDVANRDIDPDLRLYLKTSNVLHWGEARFWDKLKYALPDKKMGQVLHQHENQAHQHNSCHVGSGGSTQSSVVSSTVSVMSSMSNQSAVNQLQQNMLSQHSPQNSGIYQPQPRYTMRLPANQQAIYHQQQQQLEQHNINNNLHHIYNMPGPQYAGIYGGSVISAVSPTSLNSQHSQIAAVHI